MKDWWLNKTIYDALPIVYIALGFAVAEFLPDNIGSFIGGAVLILAGITVFKMRTKDK